MLEAIEHLNAFVDHVGEHRRVEVGQPQAVTPALQVRYSTELLPTGVEGGEDVVDDLTLWLLQDLNWMLSAD